MPERFVKKPVPGARAFTQKSRAAVLSRAAQLLLLGMDLRGDSAASHARPRRGPRKRGTRKGRAMPRDDREVLECPEIQPAGERYARAEVQGTRGELRGLSARSTSERRRRVAQVAQTFHQAPSPLTAAQLLEACLSDPNELTRVAAASAYFDLTTEPRDLLAILAQGTYSRDRLTAEVALTALAQVAPKHPRLLGLIRRRVRKRRRRPAHTSLLVHGTWARTADWWQPGGDFHEYMLKTPVRADLYTQSDRFEWFGGYSDAARNLGGADLADWLAAKSAQGADLFAHSHGGSVAMLASHDARLTINELVLLACPVHVPKYLPNFSRVSKVVSIR